MGLNKLGALRATARPLPLAKAAPLGGAGPSMKMMGGANSGGLPQLGAGFGSNPNMVVGDQGDSNDCSAFSVAALTGKDPKAFSDTQKQMGNLGDAGADNNQIMNQMKSAGMKNVAKNEQATPQSITKELKSGRQLLVGVDSKGQGAADHAQPVKGMTANGDLIVGNSAKKGSKPGEGATEIIPRDQIASRVKTSVSGQKTGQA